MNNSDKDIFLFENKYKSLTYDIESINLDRFDFILKDIRNVSNLFLFDFYLYEKEANLVHRFKMAIHTELLSTGLNFFFFNPFLQNCTLIKLPLGIEDININTFLLPTFTKYEKEIKETGFPLEQFIQWKNIF